MRIVLCVLLALGAIASAEERVKRQATYTFPGPRIEGAARQAVAYQAQQPRGVRPYHEEPDDPNLYQPVSRRQYQPSQPIQHPPAQARGPPPQQSAPVYEAPRQQAPSPRQSYSPQQAPPRKRASASNRANKYGGSAPQQSLNGGADEEEEIEGPDPLTLLLEDSKFSCGGKGDGYYADDSVNCQVFHYCVSGARHSWMCPEGTVFHQVHLNCVPDSQDICSQSQKFHFVNDYLYKPVDYDGPNNTARYAQRYYPDGYVVGDPLVAPHHDNHAASRPQAPPPPPPPQETYRRPHTRVQSYPPQVSRQPTRQLAPPPPPPPPPSYSVPSQPAGYSQAQAQAAAAAAAAAARNNRQPRPTHTYSGEVPQGYRRAPRIEPPAHSIPVEDDDDSYQPAPETRRSASPARSSIGYSPPRQPQVVQYRARQPAAGRPVYPGYAANQAAGVQYDEDY